MIFAGVLDHLSKNRSFCSLINVFFTVDSINKIDRPRPYGVSYGVLIIFIACSVSGTNEG